MWPSILRKIGILGVSCPSVRSVRRRHLVPLSHLRRSVHSSTSPSRTTAPSSPGSNGACPCASGRLLRDHSLPRPPLVYSTRCLWSSTDPTPRNVCLNPIFSLLSMSGNILRLEGPNSTLSSKGKRIQNNTHPSTF